MSMVDIDSFSRHKLLVANRGEIAVRIIRSAKHLGVSTVAIYTPSDALSPHVALADYAALLEVESNSDRGNSESKAYLSMHTILAICHQYHVTMVHPGYGFLSENTDFARLIVNAGIIWLGPSPDTIQSMGLKHKARAIAVRAGLDLVPGSKGLVTSLEDALAISRNIGFPVMLKATAGGGGMGLVICHNEVELLDRFAPTKQRAQVLFQNDNVFIERYYPSARHIEVQIFGNGLGDVAHMGERECSVQRRHQKIIEETPSPFFARHPGLRKRMCEAAVRLCESIKYESAGTVEFLVDDDTGDFFFLEMNTRIQVEHPITEAIHPGVDIVALMIEQGIARQETSLGGLDPMHSALYQVMYDNNIAMGHTHAIEARVYSENPAEEFKPSPGVLQLVDIPKQEWLRVDHWVSTGTTITPFFDPLLCKLVVVGSSREEAISRLVQTLQSCKIHGPPNNISYLNAICESPTFLAGNATTKFLDTFPFVPRALTVISGGIEATIQDLPGRKVGLGIPRSGPMDPQAFAAANIIVGNDLQTEGLEVVTLPGAELRFRFHVPTVVALTGKSVVVKINGDQVDMWNRQIVPANGRLEVGGGGGNTGFRVYLAIRGGFPEIPHYIGSKSTSMGLGGYQGRALVSGDQLTLGDCGPTEIDLDTLSTTHALPTSLIPAYPKDWVIYVLPGPHDDEAFLTVDGNARFYSTTWKISTSSNRMGIRLESKDPSSQQIQWARTNGGQGGSHPSNILDNGYALGTINVNGDTPVILTQEGPDMGGYVCLCTVASAERWKLGQLSPGNTLQFRRISWSDAQRFEENNMRWLEAVKVAMAGGHSVPSHERSSIEAEDKYFPSILCKLTSDGIRPATTFRQAGDSAILVEYGPMQLDFLLRARAHALEAEIRKTNTDGIWGFAPCIRSTMIHYNPSQISQSDVLALLVAAEKSLPDSMTEVDFPARKITFPIVLDDKWSHEALKRYMSTTRTKAVYLPSNVDYLARNNGLAGGSDEALKKLVSSPWLVFGVGFYLACPFLVPIDPRCRLVGQKMNPSRTYTPRGAVGVAGPVAAIYPVVSPGGYQLFGRTLPAWQTWGKGANFQPDKPWLLQAFDQVCFEPISEEMYLEVEKEFDAGRYQFKIESSTFSMAAYSAFIKSVESETQEFSARQREGVAREEARYGIVGSRRWDHTNLFVLWRENGFLREWQSTKEVKSAEVELGGESDPESGSASVTSSMSASIWKIKCRPGDVIQSADDVLIILEAMKTEINIPAGEENIGRTVKGFGRGIKEGASVGAGDVLVWMEG
ncbi:allophanate hydrolase subunit 2-domain-containing protein [Hygrophoropsis aurantiaca]|uniref:Allophanate hydrolase subunit 2-domain-containing protein n=1 Tax=Hygrophoropsis aurantiaca TaxID=72124 RepID=A0ACB7ZZH5_9AGAM|nr:allophanate hydrolase subunit 2-domain-containing protein [Hygrophoropsis aurantiaca]